MLEESNSLSHQFLNENCQQNSSNKTIIPIYQLKKSTTDPIRNDPSRIDTSLIDSCLFNSRHTLFNRRECKSTSDDSHTFEINNNEIGSKMSKIDLIRDELMSSGNVFSKITSGRFGFNPVKKSNIKLFVNSSSSKKSNTLNNLNLFNTNKSNLKRLNSNNKHFIDTKKHTDCKLEYFKNLKEKQNKILYLLKDNHNKKLFHAVSANEVKTVADLLDSSMYDVNCYDDKQRTCLHIACSRGYLDIVRLLLEYGANPNIRDCVSNLPIHLAIISSHVPVVTLLLEAGADIHSLDTNGKTVLHLAGTRLRWLLNDENHTASPKLKFEAIMIMNMIKEYLKRKKTSNTDLDILADQLENSFNLDDISCLTKQLLNQFETFNLNTESKQNVTTNFFSK